MPARKNAASSKVCELLTPFATALFWCSLHSEIFLGNSPITTPCSSRRCTPCCCFSAAWASTLVLSSASPATRCGTGFAGVCVGSCARAILGTGLDVPAPSGVECALLLVSDATSLLEPAGCLAVGLVTGFAVFVVLAAGTAGVGTWGAVDSPVGCAGVVG